MSSSLTGATAAADSSPSVAQHHHHHHQPQQQLSHYNLHLIPAVVACLQIHREFIVAGLRSPQLVSALLRQLPAGTRGALEEFSVQLRDRVAAAGQLHARSLLPSSAASSLAAASSAAPPQRHPQQQPALFYYNSTAFSEYCLNERERERLATTATAAASNAAVSEPTSPSQVGGSGFSGANSAASSLSAYGGGGGAGFGGFGNGLTLVPANGGGGPGGGGPSPRRMGYLGTWENSAASSLSSSSNLGGLLLGAQQPAYTLAQIAHLHRLRVALLGAPDLRCDPRTEDDIFPAAPLFGLAQGSPKPLRAFLAMPCNSDLVAWLNARLGNPNNIALGGSSSSNSNSNGGGAAATSSSGGDGGGAGADPFGLDGCLPPGMGMGMGGFGGAPTTSAGTPLQATVSEALQFASSMWLQRYPSDPIALDVEQQRCRRAGIAFSQSDAVRIVIEERAHALRARQQEVAGNAARRLAAEAAAGGGGVGGDEEGGDSDSDNGDAAPPTAEGNSSSSAGPSPNYTAILLSKTASIGSPTGGGTALSPLSAADAAMAEARRNQSRLERQKRQLLLCNLRLHFPDEAPLWTAMLAARDECLHNLADERAELEKIAAALSASSSQSASSLASASPQSASKQQNNGSGSGVGAAGQQQQQQQQLLSSFVKLAVLAENACNGLQHTNYNATPADMADVLVSRLSPIVIEAKLLKATLLAPAAEAVTALAVSSSSSSPSAAADASSPASPAERDMERLALIRAAMEAKTAADAEAARAAAKKKTPFGFIAARIKEVGKDKEKGGEGAGGSAAAATSDAAGATAGSSGNNGVSMLDLSALYHAEALMAVANKCLRAVQQHQPTTST